ncbi:MAG: MotA/TolQ/ExbB proton channel family protein, partial [Planctomycetaceae bacterium]|nr:MotA/TolQ/ExbB proton channel family protein [Planctomycetaceae bacterium]
EAVRAASVRVNRWLNEQPGNARQTALCRRLDESVHYLDSCPQGRLEDHLKYLAEVSIDRLQQSYALLKTISWAIPIIGFLGTVIGITMAIANITPEQLDTSLTEVSAGLAVAFDTTAQALAMSLVLVFASFLTERGEQSILNDVEQFGIDHLLPRLVMEQGETRAADRMAASNSDAMSVMQQDLDEWRSEMTGLRTQWSDFMLQFNRQLTDAMQQEMSGLLAEHRHSTDAARSAYANALAEGSNAVQTQLQQSIGEFTSHVAQWQQALQQSSLAAADQSEQLHGLGRTLLQLQESEERLSGLQQQMNESLQSARILET